MTAQELRIGNLIEQGVIEMMSQNAVWINEKILLIDEIQPIQLTEEWLLKFKFDNNHWATKWILHDMPTPTGIHFVHQLQNLYFALTNEELTLKQ